MCGQTRISGESVNYSKLLDGTTYTAGWVLESLRTNDPVFKEEFGSRKVKDVTSYDISKGKGFASIVLKCTVIFEDSADEDDVYSTILKVPGFASLNETNSKGTDLIEVDKVKEKNIQHHNFECEFYKDVVPHLKNFPTPKAFDTVKWVLNQQEGCIHMEDLTPKGKVFDYFDSFNIIQIKNIIGHLARMHKQLWTMDQQIWREKFIESQTTFAEIMDGIMTSMETMEEMAKERFPSIIPLIQKYRKFCSSREFMKYGFSQSYKDLNLDPVVVHGDMWASNIIFSTNKDGDIENNVVGLIDWQLIHEGSPMDDIVRLFVITLDGNTRRQAESSLLQYYLDVLTSEFLSENRQVPCTFKQMQEAYDYIFMVQAALPIFLTVFHGRNLNECREFDSINRAKVDKVILRSLHVFEDLDKLLTGKYKHLFEKFGK
ncbi:hypothetical protein FO519_009934 [Halicephalobus sp. NKZ332]|nr:hypothetical protein FO519_009934 [Halicephalobus sp. NKZ332]